MTFCDARLSDQPLAEHINSRRKRRAGRLRQRIERVYQTVCETLAITPGLVISFTRVADPDVVLDQVADEADRLERVSGKRAGDEDLHLPYWAELWDSAMGVSRWLASRDLRFAICDLQLEKCKAHDYDALGRGAMQYHAETPAQAIANRKSQIANPTLLDLGCGMGLAGTVAAAVGYDVTFADLEAPALLFARLNSLPFADRVKDVRRLNWQTDRLGRRFDVIVGADILYERQQWDFLEPFWRAHLAPAGKVLLGEPGRQTGELFGDWILSRGWKLVRHEQKVETREKPIRIFEINQNVQTRMTNE